MIKHEERLAGVHSTLVKVVQSAARMLPFDIIVIEGVRKQSRQDELWAKGRTTPGPIVTWVRHSNHQDGEAVDLAPVLADGTIDWKSLEKFDQLAKAMFQAAAALGEHIRWGADWDRDGKPRERGESDSPHFEIDQQKRKL